MLGLGFKLGSVKAKAWASCILRGTGCSQRYAGEVKEGAKQPVFPLRKAEEGSALIQIPDFRDTT